LYSSSKSRPALTVHQKQAFSRGRCTIRKYQKVNYVNWAGVLIGKDLGLFLNESAERFTLSAEGVFLSADGPDLAAMSL
jgi:hypothetical protein